MESQSNHPLARGIVTSAAQHGAQPLRVQDFQIFQGKGATARINGRTYWVGSHRYLEERGQETQDIHERLEQMTRAGETVVAVGNDRHVCGLIAVADGVRPEAKVALKEIREPGLGFFPADPERLLRALRLYIDGGKRDLGAASLGSAHLMYLTLKALELDQLAAEGQRHHTFLGIDEPEAHLHPHLQDDRPD